MLHGLVVGCSRFAVVFAEPIQHVAAVHQAGGETPPVAAIQRSLTPQGDRPVEVFQCGRKQSFPGVGEEADAAVGVHRLFALGL